MKAGTASVLFTVVCPGFKGHLVKMVLKAEKEGWMDGWKDEWVGGWNVG